MKATVTIRNDVPRRDTEGRIVDAHEPCLEWFGDRFYMYGMGYGDSDGWTPVNLQNCYSSPDLVEWTYEGALYPAGGIVTPAVKYCKATGQYVLWNTTDRQYHSATAPEPTGPFGDLEPAPVAHGRELGKGGGDFSLFVDRDGTGYIAYTVYCGDRSKPKQQFQIVVERLTDDYSQGTGEFCGPLAWNCEAPAMFRRGDTYYLLFDNTCCWNPAGTGCRVYTARAPLGPYDYRGDINRTTHADPRKIVSGNDDTEPGHGRQDVVIQMQTRSAATIPTADGPRVILIGDRWETRPDGRKGSDFTYWTSPLQFDEDGMIRKLEWEYSWTVELDTEGGFCSASGATVCV
jgi:hypothetical protein